MKTIEELKGLHKHPITITEAAERLNLTRQAIYLAIKVKRLNASKPDSLWQILPDDLRQYLNNKYNRKFSRHQGELIYDQEKGHLSIDDVSKALNINHNRIYYLVRIGKIKSSRAGGSIIIKEDDLKKFIEDNPKKTSRKKHI